MVTHQHPDAALHAFEGAVRLDPAYGLAWAGLAHALARKYWHPESPEAAARYRARAMQAAEQALRLDANLAEAHEALSTIFRYSEAEWDKTIHESRKALELKPTLELPHHNMADRVLSSRPVRALGPGEPCRSPGQPGEPDACAAEPRPGCAVRWPVPGRLSVHR
jgi:tetratricopeptide (TPR) repeat protein